MSERVIARQLLDTVKAFLEVDEMKRTGDCQKFNDLNKLWASLEK